MKVKACCIGTPEGVVTAFSGSDFARKVLTRVIGDRLGVTDVLSRPAEYYVQNADQGPSPDEGVMGVEVRLSGVSRQGRTPRQFHRALSELVQVATETLAPCIQVGRKCQVFCVIMVDGDVETKPDSGQYSNNLESEPVWVEGTAEWQ